MPTLGSTTPFTASAVAPHGVVEHLRSQIADLETSRRPSRSVTVSTGFDALDSVLPSGGVRGGSLVEILAPFPGAGAEAIALSCAARACRQGGILMVVDTPDAPFYPPTAVRAGVPCDQLVVARPTTEADRIWTLDQALQSPGVAAVLAWVARIEPHDFRRMQLAAEPQRVVGLLIRPAVVRHEPSWAETRLQITPNAEEGSGRTIRVDLLRAKGAQIRTKPPDATHGPQASGGTLPASAVRVRNTVQLRIPDATNPLYPYS